MNSNMKKNKNKNTKSLCDKCKWGIMIAEGIRWCEYGAYPSSKKYRCRYYIYEDTGKEVKV